MGSYSRDPHEVAAELLNDPRMIDACHEHDIRTIFRLLNGRGVSTRAIAEAVDISQGRYFEYVRAEKPHRVEKFALIEKISDGLRIPGAMLRLARRDWEHGNGSPKEQATRAAADAGPSSDLDEVLWLAISAKPSAAIVTGLQASIEDYWRRDDQHGGEILRPAVVGQLNYALNLLNECRDAQLAFRLHQVTAELARLAGWMHFDARQYSAARQYFAQAMRLARAIDDRPFMANVLSCMSLQATYQDNPKDALTLVRAAQDSVGQAGPARVLSMLSMREAFAHASLGDVKACHSALAGAHRAFESVHSPADDPAWIRYFDSAKLAVDTGIARARLGEHKKAIPYIEEALSTEEGNNARGRAFHCYWLATAQLNLGNLEEACHNAATSFSLSVRVESARVSNHIAEFRAQLEPYRGERAVAELSAQLEHPSGH
jgi:tetratricopeptide (TPR) repeat protein